MENKYLPVLDSNYSDWVKVTQTYGVLIKKKKKIQWEKIPWRSFEWVLQLTIQVERNFTVHNYVTIVNLSPIAKYWLKAQFSNLSSFACSHKNIISVENV